MKKVFNIIGGIFVLIGQLFSSLGKLIYFIFKALVVGIFEGIRNSFSDGRKKNAADLFDIGKLVFNQHQQEFEDYYGLFLSDKKKFLSKNKKLSKRTDNPEDLQPLEVLYYFGESRNVINSTDWQGEENEGEIESFIEKLVQQKPLWSNTFELRVGTSEADQRDGKFIIDLFKEMDKDLQGVQKKLLFFDMGQDSYEYTVIDDKVWGDVMVKAPREIHGVDRLRK